MFGNIENIFNNVPEGFKAAFSIILSIVFITIMFNLPPKQQQNVVINKSTVNNSNFIVSQAKLTVYSDPPARLVIDNAQDAGWSPMPAPITIKEGTHKITLIDKKGQEITKEIYFRGNATYCLSFNFSDFAYNFYEIEPNEK